MNENTKQALYNLIREAFKAGCAEAFGADSYDDCDPEGLIHDRPELADAVQLFAEEAGLEYP
jgi:hypothetical protein